MTKPNIDVIGENFIDSIIILLMKQIVKYGTNCIDLGSCALQLGITKSCLSHHLKSKKEMLEGYGIHIIRNPNNGKYKLLVYDNMEGLIDLLIKVNKGCVR